MWVGWSVISADPVRRTNSFSRYKLTQLRQLVVFFASVSTMRGQGNVLVEVVVLVLRGAIVNILFWHSQFLEDYQN